MSRLFDRYLLSTTLTRLPMPNEWQKSLGFSMTKNTQFKLEDKDLLNPTEMKSTGYNFQNKTKLIRGNISSNLYTNHLSSQSNYYISLFLESLKNHIGTDFTSYFNSSTIEQIEHKYRITISTIIGNCYTIFGYTTLPTNLKFYSQASGEIILEETISSISTPLKFFPSYYMDIIEEINLESEMEYFTLELLSYSPLIILSGDQSTLTFLGRGEYMETPILNEEGEETEETKLEGNNFEETEILGSSFPKIKSSLREGGLYTNKLLPCLLDIQVTEDSSLELRNNLANIWSSPHSLEKKIYDNTDGHYDRDQYIGNKLLW